ncbi:MAG: polysaccharide deacetylase family protein [Verrucomicrobiae bacterium]|nr:polysaccharide deacetylase family protein [Verrucomicrobiae bacterium]
MFHGFYADDESVAYSSEGKHLAVSSFARLLGLLKRHFQPIHLRELIASLRNGAPLPPNALVLTFDDGYESNFRVAYPLLMKVQVPATIFLATEFVDENTPMWTERLEFALARSSKDHLILPSAEEDKPISLATPSERATALGKVKKILKSLPHPELLNQVDALEDQLGVRLTRGDLLPYQRSLNWDQCREMADSGLVDFGGHTHSHCILGRVEPDLARKEIQTCRRIIEDRLNIDGGLFCYPNGKPGDYSEICAKSLSEEGYSCALTTEEGYVNRDSDPYALHRIGISDRDDPKWTLLQATGSLPRLKRLLGRMQTAEKEAL